MSHRNTFQTNILLVLAVSFFSLLRGQLIAWAEDSKAVTSDCSIALGGVKVEVNGLDNKNLICPYKDEGDDASIKCQINAPAGPLRQPGAGEMGDVTRLPQGQFEAMFFEPETYELCKDIFKGEHFLAAMKKIAPAPIEKMREAFSYRAEEFDLIQRSMATVFMSVQSWNYCHREVRYSIFTYNANFDPSDRTIVLFATSCEAPKLHYDDISYLDAGHKFYLIAGHELGHVIDDQAGQIKSSPELTEENMATVYGTYLTECFSRTFQELLAKFPENNPEVQETPPMRVARECQIANWKRLEQALAKLRKTTKPAPSVRYGNAMACVSIDLIPSPVLFSFLP